MNSLHRVKHCADYVRIADSNIYSVGLLQIWCLWYCDRFMDLTNILRVMLTFWGRDATSLTRFCYSEAAC